MSPRTDPAPAPDVALEPALRAALSQGGRSLWDLSSERPLLLIFLRHLA